MTGTRPTGIRTSGYIGSDADSAQKGNLGEGARDISGRKDEAADTTTVDNRGNEEED